MVDVYNDTKHRTTLYKPNEIFNCLDEEILETFKKILNLIMYVLLIII